MDWKEVGKKIASMGLTALGTVVGGPAGGTIGALLGNALIGGDGNEDTEITPEKVMKALGDPEAIMKMKQFEMTHELELQKLAIESERMRLSDIASARNRQVESEKVTGKRDYNLYILAWTLVVGFYALVGTMVFKAVPADSTGVVYMLFGTLATSFGCVIQYFFGSSKSSKEKTDLLANAEPINK